MSQRLPPKDPRELSIFRYFISRNIFFNLMYLLVFVIGTVLWFFVMNREAFGTFDFDIIQITTPYPGATAEEVEQLVTMPIENALKTAEGIEEMRSVSVEGLSVITLQMDPDAKNPQKNVREVEKEVDIVRTTELPTDGDEPRVIEITAAFPVLTIGLSGDVPEMMLRDIAKDLSEDILNISGVSRVIRNGYKEKEIWVEADQKDLANHFLSLNDMVERVRLGNHTSPGGRLEIEGKEIIVRSIGKLESRRDVERVVLRSNEEGQSLLLREIAVVTERLERERRFTRMNGSRSIELNVMKRDGGDTLKIDKELKQLVDSYKNRVNPKIQFGYINEISFYIQRRLDVLMLNGGVGIFLVMIIMVLFLNPQSAFWTTTAIPFAFLGGLCIMYMMGLTINLLSLFAFILVSGMLVDNGIVVSEYIEQKRKEGLPLFTAVSVGTSEMMLPVFAAVLTTIIAFAPLAMMSGIMGKFLQQMPLVLIACLVADIFECLFILPGHLYHYDFKPRFPRFIQGTREKCQAGLGWVTVRYERAIETVVRRPFVTLFGIMSVCGVLLFATIKIVPFNLFPNIIDIFVVKFELPIGATLDQTENVAEQFEKIIQTLPPEELDGVITQVGSQGDQNNSKSGTNVGEVRVFLAKANTKRTDGQTLMDRIRPDLEAYADTQKLEKFELEGLRGGPPTGRPIEVQLIGEDYDSILPLLDETLAFLRSLEGTRGLSDDFDQGKDEIQLVMNRDAIARAGLHLSDVALVIRAAFDGAEATKIKRVGETEDIKVRVKLPEEARGTLTTLTNLTVTNPRGRLVPLMTLVTINETRGLLNILRFDGYRAITVSGEVDNKLTTASVVNKKLGEFLDEAVKQYPRTRYQFGGEEKSQQESLESLFKAVLLALGLIYFVLAILFHSYWEPVIIMSVVPFALLGILIALLLTGKPLTLLVLIGFAGLTGVVVNNSIVMLDTFNRIHEQKGVDFLSAVVEGCHQRLRPIFLTTMSTFFGVMPLGLGLGGKEPFLQDMAFSFGVGLVVCAFISLFWVPAFTAASARFQNRFLNRAHTDSEPKPDSDTIA